MGRSDHFYHGTTSPIKDVAHRSFGRQRPHEEIIKEVGIPLHDALPEHLHPLVDEWQNSTRNGTVST